MGIITLLTKFRILSQGRVLDKKLKKDVFQVRKTQEEVLRGILKRHSNTKFGKEKQFQNIKTVDDFRAQIPVQDFETLRPWIEAQDESSEHILNSEQPLFYATTSGTTGKPKYIPVLKSSLKSHSKIQNLFLYHVLQQKDDALNGRVFSVVSPAEEGKMEKSGLPFGSTSGHMYRSIPSIVQNKYVVPPEVFTIEDYDLRYDLILRLALQYNDVTYITTANPSTLSYLIKRLNANLDSYTKDLTAGSFKRFLELPLDVQKAVEKKLQKMPERAVEILSVRNKNGKITYKDIWPNISVIACWTGGSCGIFFEQLSGQFPEKTFIRDIGYLSSEFRGTIPIFEHTNAGIPTFQYNYYEFVEKDEWELGFERFLGLHELEDQKEYYIFVTNDSGLYRYDMNDIVKVDGFYGQVPLLKFIQKGKGVTNITGEKLYESQVIMAIHRVEATFGLRSSFYLAVADEENSRYYCYYEPTSDSGYLTDLQVEDLSEVIDEELCLINPEYKTKRQSGRLKPLELRQLTMGAFDKYKMHQVQSGQREGQFKIVAIQYKKEISFNFDAHLVPKTSKRFVSENMVRI